MQSMGAKQRNVVLTTQIVELQACPSDSAAAGRQGDA